jgi:hypothetical protein
MNSVDRVIKIYDEFVATPNDKTLGQAWAHVFGLNESLPNHEDNMVMLLMSLRQQLDTIRLSLDAYEVPENLTHPGFQRIKDIASPSLINQSWSSYKQSLHTPECRKILEWSSWVLRDEAVDELNQDELNALMEQLEQLETKVLISSASIELKSFFLEKIRDMINAILKTKVEGVGAIREVFDKVTGAILTVDEDLVEEVNSSQASGNLLKTFMQTFKNFAEVGDKLEKFIALGNRVGDFVGELVNLVDKLPK